MFELYPLVFLPSERVFNAALSGERRTIDKKLRPQKSKLKRLFLPNF